MANGCSGTGLTPEMFGSLSLASHEFLLRPLSPASFPSFPGSTLRGAFGHALKRGACLNADHPCEDCIKPDSCVYSYLFETPPPSDLSKLRGQQRAPHPFVLIPPDQEDRHISTRRGGRDPGAKATTDASGKMTSAGNASATFSFGILLVGRATHFFPDVLSAIRLMAGIGFGPGRTPFELLHVQTVSSDGSKRLVFDTVTGRLDVDPIEYQNLGEWIRARLPNDFSTDTIKLRFVSPARIRVGGDLQTTLSFELLVRNLLRRISILAAVHGTQELTLDYARLIEEAKKVELLSSELAWVDQERYSNRQHTSMKLGGFTGQVEFRGPVIKGFLSLLVAGELLGVGTGTTFGLGRYRIMLG